jgi:hypothetical protein
MRSASGSRFDPESRIDGLVAACSLMLGLFSLATLVAYGYFGYTKLPLFDGWEHWIRYLGSTRWLTFLFSQHTEHRIPVSRLLYLADERWFHADARLLIWCTFLAQFGSAVLLYRLASAAADFSFVSRIYVLGLILALTFSASQWINFSWTFQVCFVMVFFAAIGAFASLKNSVRDASPPSVRWVIASIGMALLASGSMANGLLVWPLLVLMAVCIGLPKRVVIGLAAVGAVVIAAYLYGYQSRPGVSVPDALMRTPEVLAFTLTYLGSALDEPLVAATGAIGVDLEAYRVPLSALAGLLGIGWCVYLLIAAIRDDSPNKPARIAMLHILAFLAASALLTALGRVQFPIKDALTSRYVTPSLLFWACALALAMSTDARARHANSPGSGLRYRLTALLVALFVGGLVQLPKVAYAADSERFLSEGEYAIINNVFTVEGWGRFMSPPGKMIPVVRYFRAKHLASFSREWTYWIGDQVRAHFIIGTDASNCLGEWELVSQLGGSFNPAALAAGWGYDLRFNRPPDRIVVVDEARRIVGFATTARRRPDLVAMHPEFRTNRVGWGAYLPAGLASDLTAFLLLGDGKTLCQAGSAHVPGAYLTAPAAKAGSAIAGVDANAGATWAKSALPPGAAAPPFATETWTSHTPDSGLLRFGPVKATAGSSIGLPLITGPGASAVRVSVVDRATGDVLTVANPPAGRSTWDLWRLDLPAGAPEMIVDYVVEQRGGDWVVAGPPRSIAP